MDSLDGRAYLLDGIRRIESGEVQAGSHAAGIFGRCAAHFEGEVRLWLTRLLQSCGLQYDRDIKAHCKGAALDKTTLGNLIAGVERIAELKSQCIGLPADAIVSFLSTLRAINDDWVRMKHHEEVGIPTILDRMKSMKAILVCVVGPDETRGDA